MALIKARYFVEKPGANGPIYFWQPSKTLRDQGWHPKRLPDKRGEAIDQAQQLNAELDAWRQGINPASSAIIRKDTVADLISRYKASRFFIDKAPKTRDGYSWCMKQIESWAGDEAAKSITPRDVQTLYDALRKRTPAKANAVVRVLRLLFEYGRRSNIVEINPATRPGMIATPPRQTIWSEAQLAAMIAAADAAGRPSIGTAMMISAFLGQREGDVISMLWATWNDGVFKFRQNKTGEWIEIPAVPELEARLRDQDVTPRTTETIIASESTKKPYNTSDFQHKFADIRAAAADDNPSLGLEKLWFLDLRRTAVVWLAEEGATDEQIAAVTGHRYETTKQILETYLPRRGKTAAKAIDLLAARRVRLANQNNEEKQPTR